MEGTNRFSFSKQVEIFKEVDEDVKDFSKRVELVSPAANNLSPELQAVINTKQIKLRVGAEYCVELGFDGEVQGKQVDFRPWLPLVMSW